MANLNFETNLMPVGAYALGSESKQWTIYGLLNGTASNAIHTSSAIYCLNAASATFSLNASSATYSLSAGSATYSTSCAQATHSASATYAANGFGDNWTFIDSSSTVGTVNKNIDISSYKFISIEMQYYGSTIAQVIYPIARGNVGTLRVNGYIDSTSYFVSGNIAITNKKITKIEITAVVAGSNTRLAIYGIKA